ncbi:hypothetical protein B0H17DRAFT_1063380 [Mycena rosella]|uniref:X-box-binding protein 1 n=1 Tax=Mycena rosella TaxID=1033263 RepID=A0AAD7GJT1_MYCRO|nr:hypothetical protein B0H17DRAFT_1063380 [Mycena rosella]
MSTVSPTTLFSMDLDSESPSSPAPQSPADSEPGPSRKRARTSSSSEDRKEARAHRNRIAAQNSRDRRKAQFSYLERRVSELEEENRQLRAGLVVSPPRPEQVKVEEHQAKDRENEELRERIKTLEKGWDAVMKALAAQGLSTSTASPAPTASDTPSTAAPAPTPTPSPSAPSPVQPASETPASPAFPAALEPTMTFPISPAPSHTSLDFDLDLDLASSSSSFMSSPVLTPKTEHELDSTRHPAAGGLQLNLALPGVDSDGRPSPEESAIDDATMEDLFREILAPSPRLPSASLPFDAPGGAQFQAAPAGTPSPQAAFAPQVTADDILGLEGLVGGGAGEVDGADDAGIWTSEVEVDMLEMDRILGLLPAAADAAFQHNLEDLGLGLGWGDMEALTGDLTGGESGLVGVF